MGRPSSCAGKGRPPLVHKAGLSRSSQRSHRHGERRVALGGAEGGNGSLKHGLSRAGAARRGTARAALDGINTRRAAHARRVQGRRGAVGPVESSAGAEAVSGNRDRQPRQGAGGAGREARAASEAGRCQVQRQRAVGTGGDPAAGLADNGDGRGADVGLRGRGGARWNQRRQPQTARGG